MSPYLYYNIYSNDTEKFLGTVRGSIQLDAMTFPATRAIENLRVENVRAVISTKQMYDEHKIND